MALFSFLKRSIPTKVRRVVPGRSRSFAAADKGRLFAGWSSTPVHINETIKSDLGKLRARSRDQFINNDFVRRFVEMSKYNIAGPNGVAMQGAVTRGGSLDEFANTAIEKAWADWGRAEHSDVKGNCNWRQRQHQAIVSEAVDGEILVLMYTGKEFGKYGFQFEHIDPELLETSYNADLGGGRKIRMGIEYDANGRAVAYHIRASATYGSPGPNGRHYKRLPASAVIHLFDPQQVGQSRGYPRVSTSLASLKQLDAYFEAAITAARAGASKMGFIHTQDGAEYAGDDKDADGSILSDFEAGTIEQLPVGMDFTAFDPRYPHEQFAEFVKSMLQSISVSLGVSYSGLSGDLEGVNYSSIRAGVLEEREVWKARQQWFIDGYCRPIFERWLRAALLMNAIKLNGVPLAGDFDSYNSVVFQGRRWAWVDPLKDMNASILGINNNITTVSAVIREQGRDPEEVFQERSKEKARLAALGLTEQEVI